jgi:hypothetical protein
VNRPAFLDLLAVLSLPAADGAPRRAAAALVAREFVTRFPCEVPRMPASHAIYLAPPTDLALDALIGLGTLDAAPALAAARFFMHADYAPNGTGFAVERERTVSPAVRDAARANADKLASSLRSFVVADVGASAFAAARTPYVDHVSRTESTPCAYFGVLADAAPGEHFRLHSAWGYDGINFLSAGNVGNREIVLTHAGVRFYGLARSTSTASGATIEIALDANGMEARRYTATRPSADPSETVEIGDTALYMLDGQIAPLPVAPGASQTKVRVRNASASGAVWLGGMLVIR